MISAQQSPLSLSLSLSLSQIVVSREARETKKKKKDRPLSLFLVLSWLPNFTFCPERWKSPLLVARDVLREWRISDIDDWLD